VYKPKLPLFAFLRNDRNEIAVTAILVVQIRTRHSRVQAPTR